jgi:DNA-binding PucR family transcriptional regulator
MEGELLDLLISEAPAEAFEMPVRRAREAGASNEAVEALQEMTVKALQVRAVLEERRRREVELAALNETAGDLTGLRDVDLVLRAIVRRARQLLGTDTAYLMLIDEEAGEAYMRVTEGTITAEYEQVRLELGSGLGGLVAETASPYYTSDYHSDPRFAHVGQVDHAVAEEGINAILGVPLNLREQVIGVLFAANRRVRPFAPHEVALLQSLASHAAVAIENARLFEDVQQALRDLNEASAKVQAHSAAVEQAATAHERFLAAVVSGGGIAEVAQAVVTTLGGALLVVDVQGRVLSAAGDGDELHRLAVEQGSVPRAAKGGPELRQALAAVEAARRTSRVEVGTGLAPRRVAAISAGPESLGALVVAEAVPLDDAAVRTLERAALVTALVLLNQRQLAEAEQRVRGELLGDLLTGQQRDAESLQARASLLGVDLTEEHAVVVAIVPERLRRRAGSVAAAFATAHNGLGGELDGQLVLVLPKLAAAEAARLAAQRLTLALDVRVTAGAQSPVRIPEGLISAHADAARCARLLVALGREGEGAAVEELGVFSLLLGQADPQDLDRFISRTIGPVLAYDEQRGSQLLETLDAYFGHGRNVTRTAEALHVHVNTLYQRLERVTQLLGHDWQSSDEALQVHLAVRLRRLGARQSSTRSR